MRRVVGVVASAALMLLLGSAMGRAVALPEHDRFDLGSQLMLRLFGETSDSRASFAAVRGDRTSESPLRDLALGARPQTPAKVEEPAGIAAFGEDQFALRDISGEPAASFTSSPAFDAPAGIVHFSMPPGSPDDYTTLVPPTAHFTAAYQPVPPTPSISPAPGTLAFAPPQIIATEFTPVQTQIGALRFGQQTQAGAAQPAFDDPSYGAAAHLDVRAGKRNVNLNLSTEYDHVGPGNGQASLASDAGEGWQLPGLGVPLVVPNYADINRLSLGAGFSVPVVRGLTLNLNYDAQHLYGAYGMPGLLNLDAINNSYGGNLTFTIPRISSSLSIGAYQDRLQDSTLSINGQTQTREDVNFTVKF
ncbi:MAG: hypothetical protein JO113_01190 [Candidatus Eremiobacteraeota bacterium]|nr:hypothetical protein [Candidatus Eremiobacteraeota bacterium]